jgi:signal transduction histidine kinase
VKFAGSSRWIVPSAITAIVVAIMLWLGTSIIERYQNSQIQAFGEIGSLYIQGFVAPDVRRLSDAGAGRGTDTVDLARTPFTSEVVASFGALRVWGLDGVLMFSSIAEDEPGTHDPSELHSATEGQVVAELKAEASDDAYSPVPAPYIEIYAPIHDPETGSIIAVGEVYQDATDMLNDAAAFQASIWSSIGIATFGLLVTLGFSVRQSLLLSENLERQREVSEQNEQLRREAEEAHIASAIVHEQVLNHVGAELHDGPIQMLSLMALIDDAGSVKDRTGMSQRELATKVLSELRGITNGLILPELRTLPPREIVDLAVKRHEALTGTSVDLDIAELPESLDDPRKACLYRIIQEGLTNAFRHGEGHPVSVSLRTRDGIVLIAIRNRVGEPLTAEEREARAQLGLIGMQRRLHPFGGSLDFRREDGHAVLEAVLPV